MRQTILGTFVRTRTRPFVLGAMIGLVLNLGFVPLLNAPAAHAQGIAPHEAPIIVPNGPGAGEPAPADPDSPLLAQQKAIYTALFGGEWDADGSFYDLPMVPQEPGLLPALNIRNKLVAVLETVAVTPIKLGEIDNNGLGLPPEDVALLDEMDPWGNLIVGRLTTNLATVDVVCAAIGWNVVDPALDVPTLIVLGSFDAMLSNGGVFIPEDYSPAGGGLEALAAASITCPDGRVVQADAAYDQCIADARILLATCIAAALTALAACIAAAVKLAALAAKKCRFLVIPFLVKACLIAVGVALAAGVLACTITVGIAIARCWTAYSRIVNLCKSDLCARTAPKVVPAAQPAAVSD
ncbi:MAG: hypothetical protein JNK58_11560 [Phycisphaerae bacterium]|nr:hypothetical protein [Phycisphaerae bacterium]